MKVLYITNIPAPYRVEFWNELGKHCELSVWFEAVNEKDREWKVSGIGENFKYKFLKGYTLGIDKHINPSIIRELNKEGFDIYILGGYSSPTEMAAIKWLNYNKIPFLLNSDGGFIKKMENPILKRIKSYFISSASAYLSSGANCTKYLKYYGANEERIYCYPFSSVSFDSNDIVSLNFQEKTQVREKIGLREKVILSIGRFISLKGLDTLIEAFRHLDDEKTSLVLIGGGPERVKYEQLIKKYNISDKVVLIDFLQKKDLVKYWSIADIFVFPSRNDVWGLVLNEALAFGLPIVATNGAGGSFELVVENKNGYIIDVDNINEMAEKVRIILQDEELKENFGKYSIKLSKSYTPKEMASRHLEVFRGFLHQQKEGKYAK
jgi:glycosyltransferase involved in cell wall biosynthesis